MRTLMSPFSSCFPCLWASPQNQKYKRAETLPWRREQDPVSLKTPWKQSSTQNKHQCKLYLEFLPRHIAKVLLSSKENRQFQFLILKGFFFYLNTTNNKSIKSSPVLLLKISLDDDKRINQRFLNLHSEGRACWNSVWLSKQFFIWYFQQMWMETLKAHFQ